MTGLQLDAATSLQDALKRVRNEVKPGKGFLTCAGRGGRIEEVTYKTFLDRISRLGALYRSWDLNPGKRVLIASRDDGALLAMVLSCLEHGLSAVVVDPESPAPEARHMLEVARPAAALVDEALVSGWPLAKVPRVLPISGGGKKGGLLLQKLLGRKRSAEGDRSSYPGILESLEPAAPVSDLEDGLEAYVLFTSGSTSRPKGVRISRGNLLAHAKTLSRQLGYDSESRLLGVLSLHHADGLVHGCLTAWLNGAAALRPLVFRVTAAHELLDAVYTHRATHFITVPAMLAILNGYSEGYEDAFSTEDFRHVVSLAGYLDERLWERFQNRFGTRVVNLYGLTETVSGSLFCGADNKTFRIGTVGKPIDCRARIVDADGRDLPAGEQGELLLAGDHVMLGYLHDEQATAEVLRDGWLRTGDIAAVDDDGFYRIVGRKKSIVITGGLNVQPEEVTDVLKGIPGVQDAVAFGVEDETFGEVVAACVALVDGGGLTSDELIAACREQLSAYKVPREIAIVPALPLGPSGKVMLPQAKELLARSRARPGPLCSGNVEERVLAAAASTFHLPVEELTMRAEPGSTPGWDSFAHLALIVELEKSFALRFKTADILSIRSLGDAARVVRERAAE